VVGFTRKGWGPGNIPAGGRTRNPAGPNFKTFEDFLKTVPGDKPFCFWFGSQDPHRDYVNGSGAASGLKAEEVVVPPYLPDTPEVRNDILDYYFEVQRFDREVGELLRRLETTGRASNTLVVITGDNGWPFPRSKANLYDSGTRQPLAVRWPERFRGGTTSDALVNLADLAPTFLEAAGLMPLREMTGRSLLPLFAGKSQPGRDAVFVERERHANVREGDLGYPARAVRTKEFLYIRNFRPERWPVGDPEQWLAVGAFGDCDGSPSKAFVLDHREGEKFSRFFELNFAKRPAEELYDLAKDPHQIENIAGRAEYITRKSELRRQLNDWMKQTEDPRATSEDDPWDRYPYFGGGPAGGRKK
jgi:N-sulfoglucosamine sulfohydrolase